MRSHTDDTLREMHNGLFEWLRVCDRIERRAARPADSPLARVAQTHLLRLIADIRSLANSFIDAGLDEVLGENGGLPNSFCQIVSLKPKLMAVLGMIDFCRTQEREGHEGELNALYAQTILDRAMSTRGSRDDDIWQDRARVVRLRAVCDKFNKLQDIDPRTLINGLFGRPSTSSAETEALR